MTKGEVADFLEKCRWWFEPFTSENEQWNEALDIAIEALTTVQKHEETFEWCHDCKEYDQENHCCYRWSKVIRQTGLEMEKEFGIVRCKDCKYGEYRQDFDDYECGADGCGLVYDADFYCADGERREP